MIDLFPLFQTWFGLEWGGNLYTLIKTLLLILLITLPLMLCVAYLTYAERKIIGYMQIRIGPNRVGPGGWLQPIADALKLLFKEIIIPSGANKLLFLLAPILVLGPALAAWAVIPFTPDLVLANIDAGRVYTRDSDVVWRCRNCGFIHTGREALEVCVACLHPKAHFELLGENW